MRLLLLGLTVAVSTTAGVRGQDKSIDVPIGSSKVRLIGKLHEPLGTVLTLQGVVVEGPYKGYENGPNISVQRINGTATQDGIQIKLELLFGKLSQFEAGKTYDLKGYETGEFVGIPHEANENGAQTTAFHFASRFMVSRHRKVDPIRWSPADFVDREALLEGRAVSVDKRAYIAGEGWRLLVNPDGPWPKDFTDKAVEGLGTIRKTDERNTYRLEKGTARLVRLEDQVGRTVTLRGQACSMNGRWWFEYRGRAIHVENMSRMPGWTGYLHGEWVQIDGTLEEAVLPDASELYLTIEPERTKQFIVRKASWKKLDGVLSPEWGPR